MKILYKLTTLNRPIRAQKAIDSVNKLSSSLNYFIAVSVDEGDESANELKNYDAMYIGTSTGKINAINRDMDKISMDYKWDILVNLSDDQVFIMEKFDSIIRECFADGNLDKFIHFPDGNQNNLATMTIVGRTYYERDNFIYHPDYLSVYADNEAQDVAILRRCYQFNPNQIFLHEHPAWGKAQNDTLYLINENPQLYAKDQATYERRKAKNFID